MQKSRASWRLRQALKTRSRRWRRREVVFFYLTMLIFLLATIGEDHHGFWHFFWAIYGGVISLHSLSRASRGEPLIVTSLDDRAQLAHGVNFDQLSAAEQKEILGRYRVGSSLILDRPPDERQQAMRLSAFAAAFQFLRIALPWFAAAYWVAWLLVPAGDWRTALTDSPVLISWVIVFVVSLPSVIVMWTEPDEGREPRAVLTGART
ncbi:MAG TPA: hypothetical protein VK789_17410 [Bryobacteraceae bacterium]|nr:hypothetical protein [Bryobacteraceae bacterium]